MGSGCGDSIVDRILRPPGNSPSRWHLTRRLLLCSLNTIHDFTGNVNIYFFLNPAIYPTPPDKEIFPEKLSHSYWYFPAVFAEFPKVFPLQWYYLLFREDGQCNARS